jgi:Mpv17 / PMP22 family
MVESHYWFNFLETTFGSKRDLKTALIKTFTDLIFFAQLEIIFFMAWTNKLENTQITLTEKINNDFFTIVKTSLFFWIPSCIGIFYYSPIKLRPLFSCLTSLIWDTFMSYAAHNDVREEKK